MLKYQLTLKSQIFKSNSYLFDNCKGVHQVTTNRRIKTGPGVTEFALAKLVATRLVKLHYSANDRAQDGIFQRTRIHLAPLVS